MIKTEQHQKQREMVLDGLKVAGQALGVKTSKPRIKKELETGASLINQLMDMVMTKNGNDHKRDIEIAGLGLLAAYHLYRGIDQRRRASLVKGIFLSAALGGALIARIRLHKTYRNHY